MTYLQFHFVFTIPPILVLAWVLRSWLARHRRALLWLFAIVLIAFTYTTPWDNYLVYRDVWGYGPERVLFTIGYVPFEEYLFFVLQPILTGLFLYLLLRRGVTNEPTGREQLARWSGGLTFVLLTVIGIALLFDEGTLYMGLILAWASPVLAAMWFYTGHWFWRVRRLWFLAVAIPTLYLWVADRVAIHLGIWYIAEAYTTGWHLLGLPIEEALFFFVTNLLLVQGLLMFLRVGDASFAYETAYQG